jgi:hypothetical protein
LDNTFVATCESRGSKQEDADDGASYVPFIGGSACLGSLGPIRGMCNHVNSAKHMDDIGSLS